MQEENDKPPVFASWSGWYGLLMGVLAIQILIYYWLSVQF